VRVLDVDSFIQLAEPFYLDKGFFEQEIARHQEQFGHIAHVFSTYESRNHPNDPEPFARGINSFQLVFVGDRWWIVTIFWEGERPNNPIPDKYLPLKK
ncbi:MAG: hypothetical protein ACE5HX_13665, partial [bacterium]